MRLRPVHQKLRAAQGGSILLEGLIAILVFSMGILAIIGLQAASMRTVSDAQYRLEASYLANRLVASIWTAGPSQIANYGLPGGSSETLAEWLADVKKRLPGAETKAPTVVISGDATAGYTATVTVFWQPPSETEPHSHTTVAYINNNPTP
ncbi:pilus assembly protein PilV [Methylobacillus flagellatus]|uniref:type IV pilus modification PilV family protein n=1 Tax=Methylobacillus TaxID=404 RepID=UPI00285417C0|nr:pilus assembly protein PilV [Methylobacillus flagellatus]MDR5171899.1 pilus assembly protein PilV [Methylobacillus flagellatus]